MNSHDDLQYIYQLGPRLPFTREDISRDLGDDWHPVGSGFGNVSDDVLEANQSWMEIKALKDAISFCCQSTSIIIDLLLSWDVCSFRGIQDQSLACSILIDDYYDGSIIHHLVNGNRQVYDASCPGGFTKVPEGQLGFCMGADPTTFLVLQDSQCWLYLPGSEPWISRQNAVNYLRTVRQVEDELRARLGVKALC